MALTALPDHAEVVVNATGLGARRMADDPSLLPVRGQVVYVDQVGLDRWWLSSGADGGPVYVVPARHGTSWSAARTTRGSGTGAPTPTWPSGSSRGPSRWCRRSAGPGSLGHRVGLRPARPAVRLEVEVTDGRRVVHCYGHGGAGVTLSWGCADEVAALVGA